MEENENDSIERFFRKGVNNTRINYKERDWSNLEKMLDERDALIAASRKKSLKKILLYSLTFLLLASSGLYFISSRPSVHSSNEKTDLAINNNNTASPGKTKDTEFKPEPAASASQTQSVNRHLQANAQRK